MNNYHVDEQLVPITAVVEGESFRSQSGNWYTRMQDRPDWPELVQVTNDTTGHPDVFGRGALVIVERGG